ncbi:MAG: hypothetical protein KC505_10555 [Myxococcales bacterium]|nr:hypothetical protein [Myxococcales bacterium]
MMQEKWVKWEPLNGLMQKYYVDTVSTSIECCLKIVLIDEQNSAKKVHLVFEKFVAAYRYAHESFMNDLIFNLRESHGKSFYAEWTFFKVENSTYIEWLTEKSEGTFMPKDYIHFSLVCGDVVLDVISVDDPIVNFKE